MDGRERLEIVGNSRPVDKATARVLQRGVHHELPGGPRSQMWDSPPEMVTPLPRDAPNLIGRRFGRMVVVGLMKRDEARKSKVGLWVVRCACGRYTGKRAKTICRGANPDEHCDYCDYVQGLREGQVGRGQKKPQAQSPPAEQLAKSAG